MMRPMRPGWKCWHAGIDTGPDGPFLTMKEAREDAEHAREARDPVGLVLLEGEGLHADERAQEREVQLLAPRQCEPRHAHAQRR